MEAAVGVGLEEKPFGGAMGNVKDSLLEFRDAVEVERLERVWLSLIGGGEYTKLEYASLTASLLSATLSVRLARGDVGWAEVGTEESPVELVPAATSELPVRIASSENGESCRLR